MEQQMNCETCKYRLATVAAQDAAYDDETLRLIEDVLRPTPEERGEVPLFAEA